MLREAGISIDRSGRRVTGIEPAEIDQGQHDHNRAVLAVGSAGMLIRRDAWDQLGGFDTRLRLFRDDVDFCWRAQAAGYRVQVVTDAILYHRELTTRKGRVPEGDTARRMDRRNALYVLAANLPLLTMLLTLAGCVAETLVSTVYFLLTKQLDQAADQMSALSGIFLHPVQLWKARRRRAPGRGQGYNAVRIFIPRARPLRQVSEHIMNLLSPQVAGGLHHASASGAEDEDEQFIEPPSLARRVMGSRGVQLFVVLLLIALIAERRLLAASPLGGGALVPAWGGAAALWGEYLAGFHAVGVGSAATAPPYVAVVAALATVLGGQAWLAVDILLLGCVPLAGLTAYLATRRLVPAPAARTWIAAAYALLPVASGAVAAGRLGTTTAFIIAPLIARSAGRMLTAPPRAARSAAWATGLLVAIAAAFVPIVWVIAAGLVLALLAVRRWVWPVSVANAAIVVGTPFAILFPWSLKLLANPSSFLLEAGITPAGLATAGLRPGTLLLLSPGGPGLPPVWVTAGFGLAIVAALLRRRVALVVAGWSVAIAGFAAALALSRSTVEAGSTGGATSAWPGTALVIAAIGLLIAAAPAAEWLSSGLVEPIRGGWSVRRARRDRGRRRPGGRPLPRAVAILALAAVASAPVLAAWFWMADGVRGPVTTISSPVLPAFVAASSANGAQDRTLVLRENDGVLDYTVVRQRDPALGEPELAGYPPAEQALATQVASMAAAGADGGDPGQVLSEFGIRWVLLPSPVDPALVQRLDASVGLLELSSAPAYDLWQVTGPVARVRVIGPAAVTPLSSQVVGMNAVSAPASGGTLVLAEPYGGWTATVNGRPLAPLPKPVDGWAQGFTLPPGGGQLAISRNDTARDLSLVVEVIAFIAICVLALPGKRENLEESATAAATLAPARRGARAGRAGAHHAGAHHGGAGRRRAAGGQDRGSPAAGPLVPAGRDAASQADEDSGMGVGVLTEQRTVASGSPFTSESAFSTVDSPFAGDSPVSSDGAFPDQAPGTPAVTGWDDVIAERDSGAWAIMPADTPSRGTPVHSQAAGADPAVGWPVGADSGWPFPADTGENARWTTGQHTGAGAGPATGPGSGAHSGWQTDRRTSENAGWTTDPGVAWDAGAGRDAGATASWATDPGTAWDTAAGAGRDAGADAGWRTGPETGSFGGGGGRPAGKWPARRQSGGKRLTGKGAAGRRSASPGSPCWPPRVSLSRSASPRSVTRTARGGTDAPSAAPGTVWARTRTGRPDEPRRYLRRGPRRPRRAVRGRLADAAASQFDGRRDRCHQHGGRDRRRAARLPVPARRPPRARARPTSR